MLHDGTKAGLHGKIEGRATLLTGGRVIRDQGDVAAAAILIGPDGRIRDIGPDLSGGPAADRVDLKGRLISPGFVDMHQHLDKTSVLRFAPNPSGTLQGAREAFARYARQSGPADISRRAGRTMRRCLSRGTTAIRSHVNVDKDAGFNGIEALAQLREDWRDRMTLQLVAFMMAHPGQDFDWLDANVDAAVALADVVGGTPAVSHDPARYIDTLFGAAARAGKAVDLHLDEHLNPAATHFDTALDCVERYGMQGRTVFSHVSALSAMPGEDFRRIMDRMIRLEVGAVTLPAANLYLQGRDHPILPPRGLTRVAEMMRGGVAIATASDNIQDPFVPTGSGDMTEIARWTLLAGHLLANELPATHAMITSVPARLMGLGPDHGLKAGAWADLVVTDCAAVDTLIAGGADDMQVWSRGRPVSRLSVEPAETEITAADA
ncbi:amidohydrolase family protein [Paracoccus spongiarum]|uniref:Amidohydrolase family protein n=1 Tax=Paracoccus spongiarum TaxID=3064387 RepID=A0ABT9JFU9_9RHOB|nr:amidohydrolase family protein [Paracoccus sp. 2205BS29-5]MDP5308709.1 amidohydrolase family protein [Paracoccus sp. 2205BS29-5]